MKHNRTDGRRGKIWNIRRKVWGNLLPALVGLPPAIVGIWIVTRTLEPTGVALRWIVASVVSTWLAVDFFGLFDNARMRREMKRRMVDRGRALPDDAVFVGCATPSFAGWLDPHEDVGFLIFEPDRLTFCGDSLDLVLMKKEIGTIRFRPNVHSIVGLGRWISIEGYSEGVKIRLRVEPRERRTLLGNLRYSKTLRVRLDEWRGGAGGRVEG